MCPAFPAPQAPLRHLSPDNVVPSRAGSSNHANIDHYNSPNPPSPTSLTARDNIPNSYAKPSSSSLLLACTRLVITVVRRLFVSAYFDLRVRALASPFLGLWSPEKPGYLIRLPTVRHSLSV